jgi:hypothetical protein
MPDLRTTPRKATLLADPAKTPLSIARYGAGVAITLPASSIKSPWPVVSLEFDQALEVTP